MTRQNIRDRSVLAQSLRDWGFLGGCFGDTTIAPCDLDGIVEVAGHFLVLESKMPATPAKSGQRRLLAALSRLPNFTVLTILGDPIVAIQQPGDLESTAATEATVRAFVADWYARVRGAR